jgi:hypothetical protein
LNAFLWLGKNSNYFTLQISPVITCLVKFAIVTYVYEFGFVLVMCMVNTALGGTPGRLTTPLPGVKANVPFLKRLQSIGAFEQKHQRIAAKQVQTTLSSL